MRATRSTAPVLLAQVEGENHVVPRARISFNPRHRARILPDELKSLRTRARTAHARVTHARGTLTLSHPRA